MNIRLTFFLLVILAILGGWYFTQSTSNPHYLEQLLKKEGDPEYTGEKISTMVYDLNGKPQYFAEATEIKRYEATERTEFFKPFLDLFDSETSLKQWKVSADYAELTKDKILNLKGNVKIQSLDDNSRLTSIETESLSVNLITQDISTESKVKSKGMGFITTGIGLEGNLKKQVATLLKDVRTYMEPSVIKSLNEKKETQ